MYNVKSIKLGIALSVGAMMILKIGKKIHISNASDAALTRFSGTVGGCYPQKDPAELNKKS